MKNLCFKGVCISVAAAVLAGVLFLGMNGAVASPEASPPGDGISPTFTGLTVTGTAEFPGKLDVAGEIQNLSSGDGGGEVLINDSLIIPFKTTTQDLEVERIAKFNVIEGRNGNDITINADLDVSGSITAEGGFGTILYNPPTQIMLDPGETSTVGSACNRDAGEIIIGCEFMSTNNNINIYAAYSLRNTCYVVGKNESSTSNQQLNVMANCWNPNI